MTTELYHITKRLQPTEPAETNTFGGIAAPSVSHMIIEAGKIIKEKKVLIYRCLWKKSASFYR
jgi:hypothetical protein